MNALRLPLANLLHHKVRGALSALGVGVGVAMLITLSGLARGSLYEVADRWEAVDAELIAYPNFWQDNVPTMSGIGLPDKEAGRIRAAGDGRLVADVAPVFKARVNIAGQDHDASGVDSDPDQRRILTAGRDLLAGRWCDRDGSAARWLENVVLGRGGDSAGTRPAEITHEYLLEGLRRRGGMEIVIDSRLAEASGLGVGDDVEIAAHTWQVVGIAPSGVLTRVFMPRRTGQYLFGSGNIRQSTLMFIKLRPGVDPLEAAVALRTPFREVVRTAEVRGMLVRKFGVMFRYVDTVNAVALIIAFLFIMVTLYVMVLQRTREIAILRSFGASRRFIMFQVLAESLMLAACGVVAGVGLSLLGAWGIETARPLLTVTITPRWIGIGAAAALLGATASALVPAWRATRVDVARALTTE